MDETTQRLVERYGLDREARRLHAFYCKRERDNSNNLEDQKEDELFSIRSSRWRHGKSPKWKKTYKTIGTYDPSPQWFKIDYLEKIFKRKKLLSEKTTKRVRWILARAYVNNLDISGWCRAKELLMQEYSEEFATDNLKRWSQEANYYFDRYNDI